MYKKGQKCPIPKRVVIHDQCNAHGNFNFWMQIKSYLIERIPSFLLGEMLVFVRSTLFIKFRT